MRKSHPHNGAPMMKLIERTDCLNEMMLVKGTPDIKIITGIRRCGKSMLMESFIKKAP